MVKAIVKLILYWLLFFLFQRFIFLTINYESLDFGWFQILTACQKAFAMDLATAMYLSALPLLLLIIQGYIEAFKSAKKIINVYQYIMIGFCSIVAIGDAGIYKVWGTKLNGKALSYLAFPEEVLPTLFASENIGLMIIMLTVIFCMVKFYPLLQTNQITHLNNKLWHTVISLFVLCSMILGMRGGVQPVPLNRNWVFHSPNAVLNYSSLNGVWNLIDLLGKNTNNDINPYQFFTSEEAKKLFSAAHQTPKDTTIKITDKQKPNIIIIFLESWNPDVMACYGGDSNVTPKFGKLATEGILFKNFYSTGYRTEQGLLATLSSYPAQPVSSIIQDFGKFDKLPNLIRTYNNNGYHTSFFSGGRLFFDNVEAYLRAAGIQQIMGENDFEIKRRTVWGAYDDETFALQLRELKKVNQPFFSVLTTLTTHEWFDADVPKYFTADKDRVSNNYRNTMHYSDSCLHAFIQLAKNEDWYKNTLLLLVADHSCKFPYERANNETERHHIPMLITGGAIKPERKGTTIEKIGMHTDIAATILAQCEIRDSLFYRSKNLFNPYAPGFAYYAFDNGFGWITDKRKIIYDHNQGKELLNPPADALAAWYTNMGKAYLQINFQENIDFAEHKRK